MLNVLNAIKTELYIVIVGSTKMIDQMLVAILSNRHILLEGFLGGSKNYYNKIISKDYKHRFQSKSIHAKFNFFGDDNGIITSVKKQMKKIILSLLIIITKITTAFAQTDTTSVKTLDFDKIEEMMDYKTGKIVLSSGNAVLNVPKGFKFINAKNAQYVISDLWGNPKDTTILGALVPENTGVTYGDCYLFTITYDGMGFVKDDDAKETNYDELLTNMKQETLDANPEREKLGYPAIELIGWASKPYYDEKKKVLHWAKELKFGKDSVHTLNYDLRVLGRKGVLIMSAVATMKQLPEVKLNMENVISSIEFEKDYQYADFDSSTDEIAAWTIGGLVAGKVLAKVGFFALILKFWKVGILALVGVWAALKKYLFGGNKDQVTSKPNDFLENKENDAKEV